MRQGHIDALVDEKGGDDIAESVLRLHPRPASESPLSRLGQLVCKPVLPGSLGKTAALQKPQQIRLAQAPQLLPEGGAAAQLTECLHHSVLGTALIPGHIQSQQRDERPAEPHVVGSGGIGGQEGHNGTLKQLQCARPVSSRHFPLQLRHHAQQLVAVGCRDGPGQPSKGPKQIALHVGGGGVVAVALEKLQNISPQHL